MATLDKFTQFIVIIFVILEFNSVCSRCGVRQLLDVVFIFDESGSVNDNAWSYQVQFATQLATDVFIGPNSTNYAAVGVSDKAEYRFGLTNYTDVTSFTAKLTDMGTNRLGGSSDLAPGFDIAWNAILSNNSRSGSARWIVALTDTSNLNDDTGVLAAKEAGVNIVIAHTAGAGSYASYVTEPSYLVDASDWSNIINYNTQVAGFFCETFCGVVDFYSEEPSTVAVESDDESDVGYYLDGTVDAAYGIHCCGAIESIEFNAFSSGSFKFQIWRSSVLVSESTVSASGGVQSHSFSPKLAIMSGDVFGWYAPGVNPIGKFTCTGNLCTSNVKQAKGMGTVAVGSTFSWENDATTIPDTTFAIKVNVENNTMPTFSGNTEMYISESLAVGSSILQVTFSDDEGDTLTYTTMGTYFAFNSTTGVVSLSTELPQTGNIVSYTLQINGTDICGNVVSATLNFTVFASPPSFNNLPTEVEIGDDVREETLLIVLNVTDTNAATIICNVTSILPTTEFFRLEDYKNGSASVYLNADSALDWDEVDAYKMYITCQGTASLESVLTINILDKSITTPYAVPAWAAGAISISVSSMGIIIAMVCFLIVVIVMTTDEAEVMPIPQDEDEVKQKEIDDAKRAFRYVDKTEKYREGCGEF